MLQINEDAQSMEGSRNKSAYIGAAVNPAAWGSYEIGKSGAYKAWQCGPHVSAKEGVNQGGRYTSTYVPGEYRNKTAEK